MLFEVYCFDVTKTGNGERGAVHCRGGDLAFFPPRRIFSTTDVYICGENAAHVGGFYFMPLATSERRVPDFIVLFMFTSVGECKVNEPTTVR